MKPLIVLVGVVPRVSNEAICLEYSMPRAKFLPMQDRPLPMNNILFYFFLENGGSTW